MHIRTFVAAIAATLLAAPMAGAQNLVSNPGFESGLAGWGLYASPGCTTIGVTPSVGTTTDAHTGTTAATVTTNGCYAFISQTVSLIPGHQYLTSFWYKVTGTPSDANSATVVTLEPATFGGYGPSVTGPTAGWTQYTMFLAQTATSTSGTVAFGGNWSGGDILIDDVSVTDVTTTPEPASLALLGTGLVGLAPFVRRGRA